MTLSQLRNLIWRGLGEPTFWDPTTDTTFDGTNSWMTFFANEGQRRVALYKDRNGRHVRHRSLFNSLYFTPTNITDTIATVSNSTFPYYITVDGDNVSNSTDDRYNGWVLEITSGNADGELRLIHDYTATTRTLYYGDAFSTAPSADDTVKMYKNFELLLPSTHAWVSEHISLPATTDLSRATGNLIEVLSLTDVNLNYRLGKAAKVERFEDNVLSPSDPTMWKREGNKIIYDYPVDDNKVFEMVYYRTPTNMTADSDEPEIEEQFHYGIVIQGLIMGYQALGEASRKFSCEQDFERFMLTTINQWDVEAEISNPKGVVKLRRGGN